MPFDCLSARGRRGLENAHLELLLLFSPLVTVCNGIGVSGCSIGSYNDNGFCVSLIFMDKILRIQTGKIIVVGNTTIDSQSYIGIATNIIGSCITGQIHRHSSGNNANILTLIAIFTTLGNSSIYNRCGDFTSTQSAKQTTSNFAAGNRSGNIALFDAYILSISDNTCCISAFDRTSICELLHNNCGFVLGSCTTGYTTSKVSAGNYSAVAAILNCRASSQVAAQAACLSAIESTVISSRNSTIVVAIFDYSGITPCNQTTRRLCGSRGNRTTVFTFCNGSAERCRDASSLSSGSSYIHLVYAVCDCGVCCLCNNTSNIFTGNLTSNSQILNGSATCFSEESDI